MCAELFNSMLITDKSEFMHGKIHQTISEVLGFNLKAGSLTHDGRIIVAMLDCFDVNHCWNAIGEGEGKPVYNKWNRLKILLNILFIQ